MNDLTKAPLLNAWPRMNQNIQSEKPATNPARNQYFLPTVSQLFSKLKIKSGWSGVATIETNNIPITKDVQIFDGFCPRKVFTFSRLPDWEDGDAEGQIPQPGKRGTVDFNLSTTQQIHPCKATQNPIFRGQPLPSQWRHALGRLQESEATRRTKAALPKIWVSFMKPDSWRKRIYKSTEMLQSFG